MPRGITEADVFGAADTLLANGQRPTIERVRQELGRGSPNTVNPLLDRWWASLSARMTAKDPNDLPAEVSAAFKRFYEELRRRAAVAVASDVQGLKASLDVEWQSLESQRAAVSQQREALDTVVTALRQDLGTATRENARLAARVAELETQAAADATRAREALRQRDTAVAQTERAQKAAEQQLDKVRAQCEGNERHWLKQIDELRDALKRTTTERDQEVRRLEKRINDIDARREDAERSTAELRSQLAKAHTTLSAEREQRIALQSELRGMRRRTTPIEAAAKSARLKKSS